MGMIVAVEQRSVFSNSAPQRFDAVSSGEKTRKFRLSRFFTITSRMKSPCTRVASASIAPGLGTRTS